MYAMFLFSSIDRNMGQEVELELLGSAQDSGGRGVKDLAVAGEKLIAVQRRRRLRRLRQLVEDAAIWDKRFQSQRQGGYEMGSTNSNSNSHSQPLPSQAVFALRMLGTYVIPKLAYRAAGISEGVENATSAVNESNVKLLLFELLDMLRTDNMTAIHTQRLLSCYFG